MLSSVTGEGTQERAETEVSTKKFCLLKFRFSKISRFLERVLMEHISMNNSLDAKLQTCSICSIRIRSRNRDIFKKPQPHALIGLDSMD